MIDLKQTIKTVIRGYLNESIESIESIESSEGLIQQIKKSLLMETLVDEEELRDEEMRRGTMPPRFLVLRRIFIFYYIIRIYAFAI